MMQTIPRGGPRPWVTIILALVILVPAMIGFGWKFHEFLKLAGDNDPKSSFAIAPVVNYLLVSIGFLFLFFWAILHGMFRNIEQPKFTMMENEQRLDEEERREAEEAREEWWQHEHA